MRSFDPPPSPSSRGYVNVVWPSRGLWKSQSFVPRVYKLSQVTLFMLFWSPYSQYGQVSVHFHRLFRISYVIPISYVIFIAVIYVIFILETTGNDMCSYLKNYAASPKRSGTMPKITDFW